MLRMRGTSLGPVSVCQQHLETFRNHTTNSYEFSGNIIQRQRYDTIRGCYFNVRSKADMSQLNLPHGTDN